MGKVAATELIHRLRGDEMTSKMIDLGFKVDMGQSLRTA